MSHANRNLNRYIMEVLAVHDAPLLAVVAPGRWQIVDADGRAIGGEAATPYLAWQSAAEKVKVSV